MISYFLGGKAKSDPEEWAPNLEVVHEGMWYRLVEV